ncbi:Multidrug resistance protein 3 [Rhodococcus erythropolis]|uniref:MFS transporter n=1 Tax=Rhodococcus erythropolis TaxID=1833 RepID=UPI000BB3424D|nr:MFS transporter [Rhodococcus erythropolis]PBI97237.1 Multidrug resistance protein 3 [Rhodococcus erythropolis]
MARAGAIAEQTAPAVRPGGLVGVLAFIGILAALMQTLVVPLIAELPTLLNTTASNASWVVTATLLAGAVATPIAGRLGDLYGKRRLILICTIPLIVGSVICATASSLIPMVIGRGLQGICVSLIPLGVSALRDLLPPERLNSAIALMSSSMGIGSALGLPIAAAVAQNTSWRALFWGSAALSVLILILTWFFVPATPVHKVGGRFDLIGAIGLGAGLISLLLAVSKGGSWGWTSGTTVSLFATTIIVLLGWVWFERRTDDPLVDLRVTAKPQVLLTNISSIATGFAMYTQFLIIPQLLQLPESTGYGMGQSMLAMGLWMAPPGFVMMAVSPLGARLTALRGPKFTLITGALVLALGYGSSMLLMGSTWGLLIVACIANAGISLAYGSMPALIMGAVPPSATAAANSFNSLMRSIGTSVCAAVIGVVLAQMTIQADGHILPSEAGFRTSLLIGCGFALLAAAIALSIPVRKMSSRSKTPVESISAASD